MIAHIVRTAIIACIAVSAWAQPGGPMPVSVWQVERETIAREVALPARAQAINEVEIRPRATGILLKKHVQEGRIVKAGDLLFELEPDRLEANIRSMQASLEKANSDVKIAQQTKKRVEGLLRNKMVSEDEVDRAQAEYQTAIAQESIAKAELQRAELDLRFTKIYAPISGVVGLIHVSVGDLVKLDESSALTSITQMDPIWMNFTLPSRAYIDWQQSHAQLDLATLPIALELNNKRMYPHAGKLVFVNHQVDPSTGNVMLRAEFSNPDQLLMPGLFARVKVSYEVPEVLTIPQKTVTYNDQGAAVLLVSPDNTVAVRQVELGAFWEDMWLVTSGLNDQDQVIASSLQKLMPGMPVLPNRVINAIAESPSEKTPQ